MSVSLGIVPGIADAQDASATIAAARAAAHDNRNAQAAGLFSEAIAAAPERRAELLPELADQLTYSGKSADAIPLYNEALKSAQLGADARRHLQLGLALALSWNQRLAQSLAMYAALIKRDPHDIEALLGHARVLSWQDQLTPALHEYEHILVLAPTNLEARENIVRVQSWRGRQHDAEREAHSILATHPDDQAASMSLADAELWMGRPDRAQRADAAILRVHPADSGALDLAGDITDTQKVQLNVSSSTASSSDGLNIRTNQLETDIPLNSGLASVGFRSEPINYVGASSSAIERRSEILLRSRLSDYTELHVMAATDDVSATATPDRHLLLYDTYFTVWPSDSLRFDIGSRQETFDNVISLQQGITANIDSFSMDFIPDENTQLSLRANQAALSDGNRRGWEQVEFTRTVDRQPHLSFGFRGTSYSYAESPYNGYFDPSRYQSAELTSHIYGNVRRRFYYDASAAYGHEWVQNGGDRPTHAFHAALSYVASRAISVSAIYDSFDTRQTLSGFARTTFGLALQSKW